MLQGERTDTDLVQAAASGESSAFGELFDRWFSSSWNVARNILRDDDLAADVAQDALLTAWQRLDQLENHDAFGGWLLRITRNRALNRLERERRSQASGDEVVSGLRDAGAPDPTGAERPLGPDTISEVRDRQELLWAAAKALGEREASLLDLHLRHGLGPAEIAQELGVEANNAHQQLYRLRTKLGDAIGSYLLWRNGRPLCDGLAAAVSGDVAFDRSVARAVARHQKTCDACAERRRGLVDPSKLFAAVPLVVVPGHLKANAAAALAAQGVPTGADGVVPDGGVLEGGTPDVGTANTGMPDGGVLEGGLPDAGTANVGGPNGSAPNASNSGMPESGAPAGNPAGNPAANPSGVGPAPANPAPIHPTPVNAANGAVANPGAANTVPANAAANGPVAGGSATDGLFATAAKTNTPLADGSSTGGGPGWSSAPSAPGEPSSKSMVLLLAGGAAVTAVIVGLLGYLLLRGPDETSTAAAIQAGLEADAGDPTGDPAGPSSTAGGADGGSTGDFSGDPAEGGEEAANGGGTPGQSGGTGDEQGSPAPQAPNSNGQTPPGGGSITDDPAGPTTTIGESAPPTDDGTPDPTDLDPGSGPTTTIDVTTTTERDPITTTTIGVTTTTERDPITTTTVDTTTTTERDPITTTSTTITTTTTVTTPPPRPEILRFTARRAPNSGLICEGRTAPYEAVWATENVERAELTAGGVTRDVEPTGGHRFCGSPGVVIRLRVLNGAGEDKATATLP
ncbi:MAG: sigma-70 family RNA polymerase sigma factor [Actinomycetota bacterium]